MANAEAAYNNLSDEQKSQVANYELLSAAREAFDSLSVMKTDYMTIDGVYLDDSYVDEGNPNNRMLYAFFTFTTPDANYGISSKSANLVVQGVNSYSAEIYRGTGQYASSYHYDGSITDVNVGSQTRVVMTFKVPEGEFAEGREITLTGGSIRRLARFISLPTRSPISMAPKVSPRRLTQQAISGRRTFAPKPTAKRPQGSRS